MKRDISMFQHHAYDEKSFEDRRSFLHQSNELFQFFSLFIMFLVVNRKHFAKIFKCTFMSKQLHKLINDYSIKNILSIDAKNELIDFDIKNMSHLIKYFEMYCQIVLELTLESMYKKLNKVFFIYRCYLNALLINYFFDSMLIFHKIFMYARINEIQNDLEKWKIIDKRMKDNYLICRNRDFENNKLKNSKLDKLVEKKMSYDYCKRFNHDLECQNCSWKHQCVVCQSLNHNMKKCFQIFSFSRINKILIDISRRQWLTTIISIFLQSINENFSYELTFANVSSLQHSKSLRIIAWETYLQHHLDRRFVKILIAIMTYDAKVEYIDFNQLLLFTNHFFAFNAFEILTIDFQKQIKTH